MYDMMVYSKYIMSKGFDTGFKMVNINIEFDENESLLNGYKVIQCPKIFKSGSDGVFFLQCILHISYQYIIIITK